ECSPKAHVVVFGIHACAAVHQKEPNADKKQNGKNGHKSAAFCFFVVIFEAVFLCRQFRYNGYGFVETCEVIFTFKIGKHFSIYDQFCSSIGNDTFQTVSGSNKCVALTGAAAGFYQYYYTIVK